MEQLNLTQEWDKVFPKSDKVDHKKVTFHNRYGITLAADMYIPKGVKGKMPAIAVSGPFGAVKEQSSGLYAQKMAELGFLTIAFDPSYTGESGGTPRYVASPDINTEDFCAAVDFLSVQEDVDSERIGIIGICGWGGMAINAAAIDTRIKATAAISVLFPENIPALINRYAPVLQRQETPIYGDCWSRQLNPTIEEPLGKRARRSRPDRAAILPRSSLTRIKPMNACNANITASHLSPGTILPKPQLRANWPVLSGV